MRDVERYRIFGKSSFTSVFHFSSVVMSGVSAIIEIELSDTIYWINVMNLIHIWESLLFVSRESILS